MISLVIIGYGERINVGMIEIWGEDKCCHDRGIVRGYVF